MIYDNPLDEETLAALKSLHVEHSDPVIALCHAFQRAVNFNYDPNWSDESMFAIDGQHIWPTDGSEWASKRNESFSLVDSEGPTRSAER